MDRDIRSVKGIGESRAKMFSKMKINTLGELLYLFPRSYEDRSKIKDIADCIADENVCICITVFSGVREMRIRKNLTVFTARGRDESGFINIVWYNNRFVKNVFKTGEKYVIYGRVSRGRTGLEIVNPVYEKCGADKYVGKIIPIYPLSGGLSQKNVQSAMAEAIKLAGLLPECLPDSIRMKYNICEINYAIKNIHFPEDFKSYETARRRFVFEELFVLQLALLIKSGEHTKNDAYIIDSDGKNSFISRLPFKLTGAQLRTIDEIAADMASGKQMCRLVQGDVGSGKTIVAAAAAYLTIKSGHQAVIMAPTEILAAQHYDSMKKLFEPMGIRVVLLTGGVRAKEKRFIKEDISLGTAQLVVGTNAVIQKDVDFFDAGLVIVDEQHRFGVEQRGRLIEKSNNPHLLVMSATPIPRTLALILYGDLKISVIDELPPGRSEVKTYAVGENMRTRINAFIEKNLADGGQCYVVCPLVSATEKSDLKNAEDISLKMSEVFKNYKVGLMHGKMKPQQKKEIMDAFASGELDILVSTTVIEVGINVPNSNMMIIENAERFGLSQLHQLRGRVGRGERQSYCILFAHGSNEVTKKRMETMCISNDGFYISEQDLKLRGPGDFFGTRQHGLPEMKIANLFEDADLLRLAQKSAQELYHEDYELLGYPLLKKRVEKVYTDAGELN